MTNTLTKQALLGPRLPPLAIWTWRLLLLLLALHWLMNLSLIAILAPELGGDKQSSNQIMRLIHPQFLFELFQSRITLWRSRSILTIVTFASLLMDVLVSPLTWFAFQRRHSSHFRLLLVWRMLVVAAVIGTDIALVEGNFNLTLDFGLVDIRHLVAHDSFLAFLVLLMLLIAPDSSPLQPGPLPPSPATPTKPVSPSALRRAACSTSCVWPSSNPASFHDAIPTAELELRSQRYASRVITSKEQHQLDSELMSAFQQEFLAHAERPFSCAYDASTLGVVGGRPTRTPRFHAPPPPPPAPFPTPAPAPANANRDASRARVPVVILPETAHAIVYDARYSVYCKATPVTVTGPRPPQPPAVRAASVYGVVPEHVPVYQVVPPVPSEVGVQAQVAPSEVSSAWPRGGEGTR